MSESRAEVLQRLRGGQYTVTEIEKATFAFDPQSATTVFLDRLDERTATGEPLPSEYALRADATPNGMVIFHPQHIPALIDALTLMHRAWLIDLDGS